MKEKRRLKRKIIIVAIVAAIIWFLAPMVVKTLSVRLTIAKLMGVCKEAPFFAVVSKLPFEEDPLKYLQELSQEPWRIETLSKEGDLKQVVDKETSRLIAARFISIELGKSDIEEKINCFKVLKEGYAWLEFLATKQENNGRVYYREIRRVQDKENHRFLRAVVVLRPRSEDVE